MASVNYQKIKTAREVKAKIRHDEKEQRKEATHTNPNINKDLTDTNLSYRRKTLLDGSKIALSYDEICEEYDSIMKGLDGKKGANKRKDRVTCLSMEVPTPDGMTEDQEEDYFLQLGRVFEEEFPECYLLDGFFHRDEKHKYYDPEDKTYKESRSHATFRYIPIKDGKLNAKKTLTRSKMRQVNTRLNEMCMEQYGLNFNNGKGKRGKSVEQLKAETNLAEMKKTEEELENKRKDLQELNDKYNTLQDRYNTLKDNFDKEEDYQEDVRNAINGFIGRINERDAKREFITEKGLWSEFLKQTKKNMPQSKEVVDNIKKKTYDDYRKELFGYMDDLKAFKNKVNRPTPKVNNYSKDKGKGMDF